MMRLLLISAAFLLLGACDHERDDDRGEHGDKVDVTAESAAIGKLEQAQIAAINAKDPAGSTALYGDDAVLITSTAAINGKEAIVTFYKAFLTDPNVKFDYKAGEKSFSEDGDLAFSTAAYTESFTDPATKKPITVKGTNLSIWRKQEGGGWKLVRDANADSPVAG